MVPPCLSVCKYISTDRSKAVTGRPGKSSHLLTLSVFPSLVCHASSTRALCGCLPVSHHSHRLAGRWFTTHGHFYYYFVMYKPQEITLRFYCKVDPEGFEPSAFSMPLRRAPNCAMGPGFFIILPSGPEGIRTPDLFSAIEARSQLRYRPFLEGTRILLRRGFNVKDKVLDRSMV